MLFFDWGRFFLRKDRFFLHWDRFFLQNDTVQMQNFRIFSEKGIFLNKNIYEPLIIQYSTKIISIIQ